MENSFYIYKIISEEDRFIIKMFLRSISVYNFYITTGEKILLQQYNNEYRWSDSDCPPVHDISNKYYTPKQIGNLIGRIDKDPFLSKQVPTGHLDHFWVYNISEYTYKKLIQLPIFGENQPVTIENWVKGDQYSAIQYILQKNNKWYSNLIVSQNHLKLQLDSYGGLFYSFQEFIDKFSDLIDWTRDNQEGIKKLEDLILKRYE